MRNARTALLYPAETGAEIHLADSVYAKIQCNFTFAT